eukprot:scaffold19198_cov57-Attheya_sp.AAC.1
MSRVGRPRRCQRCQRFEGMELPCEWRHPDWKNEPLPRPLWPWHSTRATDTPMPDTIHWSVVPCSDSCYSRVNSQRHFLLVPSKTPKANTPHSPLRSKSLAVNRPPYHHYYYYYYYYLRDWDFWYQNLETVVDPDALVPSRNGPNDEASIRIRIMNRVHGQKGCGGCGFAACYIGKCPCGIPTQSHHHFVPIPDIFWRCHGVACQERTNEGWNGTCLSHSIPHLLRVPGNVSQSPRTLFTQDQQLIR